MKATRTKTKKVPPVAPTIYLPRVKSVVGQAIEEIMSIVEGLPKPKGRRVIDAVQRILEEDDEYDL